MILFLGKMSDRSPEGAAQRIYHIDQCLSQTRRVYVHWDNAVLLHPIGFRQTLSENSCQFILSSHNPLHWLIFGFLFFTCRWIYLHSIYSVSNLMARVFLGKFKKSVIWDVHGVVPEERELLGYCADRNYYEKLEKLCAERATTIIVVSKAMDSHLRKKHPCLANKYLIHLPILPDLPAFNNDSDLKQPLALYSGGAQSWQNPDLIVDTLRAIPNHFRAYIFTNDVEQFKVLIAKKGGADIKVKTVSSKKLFQEYAPATYGLILRDDHIVNQVSSPTKLSEYLHFGIVPIVKSPLIGDYQDIGYQWLPYSELMAGQLPSEDQLHEMRVNNYRVVDTFKQIQAQGLRELTEAIYRI